MIEPCLILLLAGGLLAALEAGERTQEWPNVLFIAIDDLRPELGCYGSELAVSPNLDQLAKDGLQFNRAYCQQAICGPSRASLLTGTRPDTTGIVHNFVKIRELAPDVVTLPQHFIANGYEAVYCGKIFHQGNRDDDRSWSRKPARNRPGVRDLPKPRGYQLPENIALQKENMQRMLAKYGEAARRGLGSGPADECADVPDHAYSDGFNTRLMIATLEDHLEKKPGKPIFLGLGFHKPHLNWVAPKRYWDLYDREKLKLAAQTEPPKDGSATGLHASFELRTRANIPKLGPLGEELSRTLLHAYLACVSYVDAQVGLMIEALEKTGRRENTIIIVWSDHGWHLGEMGVWGKATNYEIATRVPMMIWTPDMKSRGKPTEALVELLDIYPTLCELAGIPTPNHCEGRSFVPLLDDPDQRWKKGVVSQFPNPALREWAANPLSPGMRETFFGPLIREVEGRIIAQQGDQWDRAFFENYLMGYALRTDRHRLVLWRDHRDATAKPVYVELYDHESDPTETTNIAKAHPELVRKLTKQLDAIVVK